MSFAMRILLISLVLSEVRAEEVVAPADAQAEFIPVRLVATKISETRGQNLSIRLESLEDTPKVFIFTFPTHSFSPHEKTLIVAVRSCRDLSHPNPDEWVNVRGEANFLVHPGASPGRRPGSWTNIKLVSVSSPEKNPKGIIESRGVRHEAQ